MYTLGELEVYTLGIFKVYNLEVLQVYTAGVLASLYSESTPGLLSIG